MSELDKKDERTENPEVPDAAAGEESQDASGQPVAGEESAEIEEDALSGEEVEFDLEAQIDEFRRQIEAEPENCIHYYNLGEALSEMGNLEAAKTEFENALKYDAEGAFGAVIHFGIGNLHFTKLMKGISANVVKSSVGLLAAHKDKTTITDVNDEDYASPIREFEMAIHDLPKLKADEEIADYVSKTAPGQIASAYYKWASDLIDKSRQLTEYGGEIRDVQRAMKFLKKTLDIEPNHSAAQLMTKLCKKMLAEGWQAYDEYGFLAKEIHGLG